MLFGDVPVRNRSLMARAALAGLVLATGLQSAAAQPSGPPPAPGAELVPERVEPPRPDAATIPPAGTPGASTPLPRGSPDPGIVAPTPPQAAPGIIPLVPPAIPPGDPTRPR